MRKLSLDELKNVELNILLELQKVCSENALRLYLISGTLLGAVRHKGFIPWDDDIDVGMPRPDYDRLVQLYLNKCFPEYLELVSPELGNYNRPFAKLLDTRTIVDNKKHYLMDGNARSVWVDIMPIDGLPDDEKESIREFKKTKNLISLVKLSNAYFFRGSTLLRAIMKTPAVIFARIMGSDYWNQKILQTVKQNPYEESVYVGQVAFTLYGPAERMKRSEFEKVTEVEFEGHLFYAVADWDCYLRNLYGNYMELPPEEKRKTHEMTVWIKQE